MPIWGDLVNHHTVRAAPLDRARVTGCLQTDQVRSVRLLLVSAKPGDQPLI